MYTADCLNKPIKIYLALFAVYAILIMFVYNMQVPETSPRKQGYGIIRNNKYILQWTNKSLAPFNFMGAGNSAFIKNNCKYTNCYITDNASGTNQTDFDAIAFNGRDVIKMNISQLPTSRSPKQKYIFAATESSDRFPVCNKIFDGFFNWTWTYKLDSNLRWGYITIYDRKGEEIGPAIDMKWLKRMDPVSDKLKLKLSRKSKTAAWFVSHCHTDSKREDFVNDVNKELKKYKRHVDIYGSCGSLKCPKSDCKQIVNEYYFYFAFENSFAEDYVTEKLLTALNNNAVPVVFGSANYSSILFTYNTRDEEKRPYRRGVPRNIKYILRWTGKSLAPFNYLGEGNSAFIKNRCKYTNCFVTDDGNFLNQSDFDAVLFNGRDVTKMEKSRIPRTRSPKQKYVFAATESADRFPVCNEIFDSFFNWTWTYKLDSSFRWGYITIYDKEGQEIGPAIDMKWPENMDPVSDDLKSKLSHKTKASAWFVSHCKTNSKREDFVADINRELRKFGWEVDIYGSCGKLKCPRSNWRECAKLVEKDYYFYFSFENSFSEDYVTEKLLTALNSYSVPVVFGSANYTRFLPDGSYLDGRKLGAKRLARVMNELIADKSRYYEFFRWRNHFSYALTTDKQDICKLCEALNNEHMVNTVSVWKDFRKWWNGASHRHCK